MPRLRSAIILLTALLSTTPLAAAGRLPTGVTPLHYDLQIEPDAKALRFSGSETATIALAAPTRTITLNAADLTVSDVMLDGTVKPGTVKLDAAAETLTLTFAQPVSAGQHRLSMRFAGKINQSAAGLFAVDYQDPKGKPERLLVTQFEPADARRLAPMWDEPGYKATFTLTAVTPKGDTAFSNMPVARRAPGAAGKTLVTFATSPKMSSYLLFLGMGDVERRTRKVGATEIGVITRRGAIDQGDYALESAAKILAYYNDYFGTPYPLPKLDMIAAPGSSQFFSAMENWGAILYFDRSLLLDPKVSTESTRQRIFVVIAHEMAHQWFGDLVTMAWWDDLWLNEGFASWMEGKTTDLLNPDWKAAEQVVASDRQYGLGSDAQSSTHAIVQPIATVEQIGQSFDAITYQKGQAVIGMLEAWVGPDAFRAGVRTYMAKHKYGNTRTDDLWAEISAAAGRPVKPLMDSFTLQGGVPLIRAGEPRCVGGKTEIALSQDRFGVDAPSKQPRRWLVPVEVKSGGSAQAIVSAPTRQTVRTNGCAVAVVNPGQSGYYRTLYAPAHQAALGRAFSTLALADQLGLMADTVAMANGGYAGLDAYLTLLDRIPATADPLVWSFAASQLLGMDPLLNGDPMQAGFRRRSIALLSPQFDRVTLTPKPGETPMMSRLREALITTLGRLGDPRVVGAARAAVAGGLDKIPAATREPLIGVFGYNASPAEWEQLRQLARAERNPIAKRNLYAALSVSGDSALAEKTLALALTDEATAPDRAEMISGVSRDHPERAFDWAVAHADAVNPLLETTTRPGFIVGLAARSTDPSVATRVRAYADRAIAPTARQGAETAIASIGYRAQLRRDRAKPLAAWIGSGRS